MFDPCLSDVHCSICLALNFDMEPSSEVYSHEDDTESEINHMEGYAPLKSI